MAASIRFGERLYTTAEIRDSGFRHGRDGIRYYPPSEWRGGFNSCDALDRIYAAGYGDGEEWYRMFWLNSV